MTTSRRSSARPSAHKATLVAQRLDGLREQFADYAALGEFYAAALERDHTPAAAYNALREELNELSDEINLHMNSPIVLRLLYPHMRYYARRREMASAQAAST